MVNCTSPGMTLIAPGFASMRPTVPTSSGSSAARFFRRRARIPPPRPAHRGAVHGHGAGMARLAAQRDAKAGEAVDRGDHAHRQAFGLEHRALLDVELRVGENLAFLRFTLARCFGLQPELRRNACAIDVPRRPSSRAPRGRACRRFARLPRSVVPKRTPSSSPKPTTSIAKGSLFFCVFSASTHSMALITPSMPSYFPASRTVSRCEPSMRQGSPARSPS